MNALINEIKQAGEDFEFYPTTDDIIYKMVMDMKMSDVFSYRKHSASFLDVGAGNGKVISSVKDCLESETIDFYAIEKSGILRANLDKSIYIIGTDFFEQSLIDKDIEVTFSNPPYSIFEQWAKKILRESNSKYVYLVIPTRWTESEEIKEAIKYRDTKYKILGEFNFLSADRRARAVVNLVRFDLTTSDAFNKLFEEEFTGLVKKNVEHTKKEDGGEREEKDLKFGHLVTGKNFVKSLVEMYREDLANLKRNYAAVGQLDPVVMKELGIDISNIRDLLKERLKGLKNLYWKELISRMKEVTDRLISKKRDQLLKRLNENGAVDFTEENIYSTVLWIIKNSSAYIDEQLIEVYEKMIEKANIKNYKSNSRVYEKDRWRYNDEKPTHISLEYRMVLSYCGGLKKCWSGREYEFSEYGCEFLGDLFAVSSTLGFPVDDVGRRTYRYERGIWAPGGVQEFTGIHDGQRVVVAEVRAHLNGNLHVRMNQKLMLKLNVEYGRLKGWLHSKGEAAEELQDVKAAEEYREVRPLLSCALLALDGPKEEAPKEVSIKVEPEPEIELCCQVDLFAVMA